MGFVFWSMYSYSWVRALHSALTLGLLPGRWQARKTPVEPALVADRQSQTVDSLAMMWIPWYLLC